ncbi:SCO family protein [Nocardioides sp. CFH 31398]|uniref:SCO family protein n=1 Tax=Nocardioides sp. CFH 31398 TaxID=2919579 RepID=UPI001F05F59B|nr:SCO family protein [Nocardioides sp. CFH 31398]MCH1868311.1 SCO family protein [Nocardioides sp. CFH 31398]
MRERLRRTAAALAVAPLLLLAACGGTEQLGDAAPGAQGDGMNGDVLDDPYVVPDVTLTDTDGAPYDLAADTTDPLTLVFFGFTNCPDICNVVMSSLASARTRLSDAQRDELEVVFVTTDPARDDEDTIRAYLDRFDPSFTGLTGDLGSLQEAAAAFSIFFEKGEKLPSGGYDVAHGSYVAAVDGDDRVPVVWDEQTSAAELAEDVSALLEGTEPR